jgi:drug/metabolite transporter (DMT)-like permease
VRAEGFKVSDATVGRIIASLVARGVVEAVPTRVRAMMLKRTRDFPVPAEKSARRRGVLLVLIATVMWSLAGVFARLVGHLDLWTVMGWRATLGAASISLVGLVEWRRGRMDESFGFGRLSPVVAGLATIAISAYTASVMTTTIADVMIIYATLPFVAAGVGWLVNREAVSLRTLAAGFVAFAGILIMVGGGFGSGRLLGQAMSALMTVAFAGMVVLQRRRPGASIIAVNAIGAFGSGLVGFALSPHPPLGLYELGVLFLFGLTTIGLAFVLFMEGAKFIPSAEAGLISLIDVVLAPVWVFLAFGENPGVMTVLGGAIVLGAAVWRIAPDLKRRDLVVREDRWTEKNSPW